MAALTIDIIDQEGTIKKQRTGTDRTYLDFLQPYRPDDCIRITVDQPKQYLVVQVDEVLNPSFIFLPGTVWTYAIPTDAKLLEAYPDHAFSGSHHYLSVRTATKEEIGRYKNLALNPHDQKPDSGAYPHAFANVETRNDATFFARNAIDGILANEHHGEYPYQSWGINRQPDAWINIDFGRPVEIDRVDLVLRGDFPHDSYWTRATLECSDGSEEVLTLNKTRDIQSFRFNSRIVQWVKLKNLIKADDESPFPALTEIAVYGRDLLSAVQ